MKILNIATRKSRLALWQAHSVADHLQQLQTSTHCNILGMTTEGDRRLDARLGSIGGKGLFLKELEHALHQGDAQLAVHSAKDVPALMPPGLKLTACLERETPNDAFVSRTYPSLEAMPAGSLVGTSSLRRAAILKQYYPQLTIRDIRGNLETRLAKLDSGDYHAIILAAAGLKRLGMTAQITSLLETSRFIPAIGQGIIVMQTRDQDTATNTLLDGINHLASWRMLMAERAFGAALGADCHLPIAAHATILNPQGTLSLHGLVASTDGTTLLTGSAEGDDPTSLGTCLANRLIQQGALQLLEEHHSHPQNKS